MKPKHTKIASIILAVLVMASMILVFVAQFGRY